MQNLDTMDRTNAAAHLQVSPGYIVDLAGGAMPTGTWNSAVGKRLDLKIKFDR